MAYDYPSNNDSGSQVEVTSKTLTNLRTWNIGAGILHLASALAMTFIASDFSLTVTTFNLNGPPGTPIDQGTVSSLFDIQLAPLTAGFLFLSSFFHLLISTVGFSKYGDELRRGRNRFRWVEYSLSSTLMIVTIALITTVTDAAALVGIAFANISMILFGWLMEVVNEPNGKTWWTPFWFGCVAGIGPWFAIGGYVFTGDQQPPSFVYGILISIFLFFNCFALNQWLQYRKIGPWKKYLVGERTYILLSLVAKSALAWQLYANVLIPE